MAAENSDSELVQQLKELIQKLNKPKKDIAAWLGLSISFLSTVVIAGLSLYFSNLESERSNAYNLKQLELQKANLKVEELKALNSLIPALSSKDTAVRNVAFRLLEAAHTTVPGKNIVGNTPGQKGKPAHQDSPVKENDHAETTVIDQFYNLVSIAQSHSQPVEVRKAALGKIGRIAASSKTPASVREKAVAVTTGLASSATEPAAIKAAASDVLKNIKNVSAVQVVGLINAEKVTRTIDGVVIHATGPPTSIESYKGLPNILSIANFQFNQFGWNSVSWHYLIAPDGSVWLGAPLNSMAIHTANHNKTTVSVILYLDGDKQLPTEAQRETFKQLTGALLAKLNLGSEAIHTHRYFTPAKTCPGKLITDDYIRQLTAGL